MTTGRRSSSLRDRLEAIVREYHHLLEEHRRAGAEGRVRRHMETRLHGLEARFERLLGEWARDKGLQRAWRAHLHADAPEPSQPSAEEHVSDPALEALAEFVAERERRPPWHFAAELAADGLVDRDFGLTSRGHRALARKRGA